MKRYRISLSSFDGDSETERMLDDKQYAFLNNLFDELNRGQGFSDYTGYVGLEEVKAILWQRKEVDGKVAAYIDNAEYLKEGQELTYSWNGEKIVFTIESICSDNGGHSSATRLAILSPNDRVTSLPLNATLETDY